MGVVGILFESFRFVVVGESGSIESGMPSWPVRIYWSELTLSQEADSGRDCRSSSRIHIKDSNMNLSVEWLQGPQSFESREHAELRFKCYLYFPHKITIFKASCCTDATRSTSSTSSIHNKRVQPTSIRSKVYSNRLHTWWWWASISSRQGLDTRGVFENVDLIRDKIWVKFWWRWCSQQVGTFAADWLRCPLYTIFVTG